jgi:HD-GYP domain-containing protein (c-di-GMP phosphodiesterase class II)
MQGGGHPVMSERILAMFGVPKETLLMVRHHHEKYSGSGFPDGLKGKSIPLGARVIFLAEHYVMGVERESANGPGYHERVMRNLQNVDGIDPYLLKSLDTLHNEI